MKQSVNVGADFSLLVVFNVMPASLMSFLSLFDIIRMTFIDYRVY